MALALTLVAASAARAETEVDLALVLAVDVSRSMDRDEQRLQRDGYAEAFRSPLLHDAIRKGATGRITVSYVEWSGPAEQKVVMPWTVIDGPAAAMAFSDKLAAEPIGLIFSTSISGIIDFSTRHLDASGSDPIRRVIDVSGDGPNNTGRAVTAARDEAVAKGITINGLPFMLKMPTGFGDIENLDRYYEDCVIGGQGAFIVPVRERHQIADAIRTKIVREIANDLGSEAKLQPASDRTPMNCMIGELQRRRSWGP